MKRHLIYALVECESGDIRYVGRSSSGLRRPKEHEKDAWKKNADGSWKSQLFVSRWIRSLGHPGMIEIRVLEELDPSVDINERLNDHETRWVADVKADGHRLTNLTEGGGGILGYHHTDESKAKIAEASRQQVWTESRRRKISESISGEKNIMFGKPGFFRGKRHSVETRARISAIQTGTQRPETSGDRHWTARTGRSSNAGREFSPEWRANISAAQKGKTFPNRKGQRVLEERSGLRFDQAVQAARHFGVSKSTVSRSIRDGVERQGFIFRLID